jgi:hypothetical protein
VAITLDTLAKLHAHGYQLSVFCRPCGRHVFLDLSALMATGQGERPLVGLRLRCRVCGARGEMSVIWEGNRR